MPVIEAGDETGAHIDTTHIAYRAPFRLAWAGSLLIGEDASGYGCVQFHSKPGAVAFGRAPKGDLELRARMEAKFAPVIDTLNEEAARWTRTTSPSSAGPARSTSSTATTVHPRLWGLKSVSKAAAVALDRRSQPERRSIGFHLPRAR